jgi:hypothetical protein
MPRIPTFQPSKELQIPYIPSEAMEPMYEAGRTAVKQFRQIAADWEKRKIDEIELDRKIEQKAKALQIERGLRDDIDEYAERFNDRIDVDKWDQEVQNGLEFFHQKYQEQIGNDKELSLAFDAAFNSEAHRLTKSVRAQKRKTVNNIALGEFNMEYNRLLEEGANASTPEEREIVRNDLSMKAYSLVPDVMNLSQAVAHIDAFDKNVKQKGIDLADVAADKAIENDPNQAFINLHDSGYLPNLLPKQRQDKVEKAKAAMKVWENEQKQKVKDAEDLAIKKEDQEISDLYLAKKYTEVYARAQASKILPGSRKQHWGDAAEAAAERPEKIDPLIESKEYAFINNLMAKDVDPKVIQDSIIISPRLTEPKKIKLLDRLEKLKDNEIKKASIRAYEYMKREIVSPSGIAGVMAKIIPEDVRANNYARAQNALDDWIDKQMITEKPITGTDVLTKAEELVKTFRPKFNQNSPIIEKKNQDLIKGLKDLGDMNKGFGVYGVPPSSEGAKPQPKPKQIKYKSIEEIKNAYDRKELSYGEAEEILRRDFGLK